MTESWECGPKEKAAESEHIILLTPWSNLKPQA